MLAPLERSSFTGCPPFCCFRNVHPTSYILHPISSILAAASVPHQSLTDANEKGGVLSPAFVLLLSHHYFNNKSNIWFLLSIFCCAEFTIYLIYACDTTIFPLSYEDNFFAHIEIASTKLNKIDTLRNPLSGVIFSLPREGIESG